MPIGKAPFSDEACEAFFGGLLPESEHARKFIARRYNADPDSTFSLLKAIGQDCAGAISLHDPSRPLMESDGFSDLEGTELTETELAKYIKNLSRAPLFSGIKGLRMSLAGVQDKAAVCLIDSAICIPEPGVPTSHILKSAIKDHEATVQNEYLCMSIAANLGLPAAKVEMRHAEDQLYLLVERYDREITATGKIRRIHQEDFCQALAIPAARKYQAEGGPGFRECFELLTNCERPAVDRTTLARVLIVNYLLGNADAHGKNFSLLHPEPNLTRLAPSYDLLSISVYDELEQKMAMEIGGCYDAEAVKPQHWQALCKEIRFGYPAFRKELARLTDEIIEVAEAERLKLKNREFDTWIADDILRLLQRRCNRVKERYN
jgi:serine/threonine-protein kinase HipA